jgi:dTDP-4-amino-4,6-dideoxygalactose transaminase
MAKARINPHNTAIARRRPCSTAVQENATQGAHAMTTATTPQTLALEGGAKAISRFEGQAPPKIGVEDFLALARRFGFSDAAMQRLAQAVSDSDLPEHGPTLAKYATTHPKPAAGEAFERRARELFGSPFALGVSSGTAALHAAMVAVGAGPGKEVIVPGLGFMATAIAVALTGATPVFCDVDHSLQIDPGKIEACITPRTVAIAPTHHWGVVADLDPILRLARKHSLLVIEDCAQSPGASYKGKPVGTLGDIGCFSISAYKIIGGGEGGLVLCRDQRLFDRVNQLAECGGLWRPRRFDPPRYEGELFVGANYRMSELEAAIDTVQLDKLATFVGGYRQAFTRIARQLLPVREVTPQRLNDAAGAIGYQMRFFPRDEALRARLVAAMKAEGLPVGSRGSAAGPDWHVARDMFPLRHGPQQARNLDQCPVAADLYFREISLHLDHGWTSGDADMVAAAMNKVLAACCTVDPAAPRWME